MKATVTMQYVNSEHIHEFDFEDHHLKGTGYDQAKRFAEPFQAMTEPLPMEAGDYIHPAIVSWVKVEMKSDIPA